MASPEASSAGNQNQQEKPSLHPAYTVTNINNKIRTLDGKKVTYSSWVKLFNLHARAYKVLHHIDGTAPPEESDPSFAAWSEIDALILQWIYSTLSDDILARVLSSDLTARAAWLKIHEIFVNNKQARVVTLETKFTNTTLTSCASFDDYCQTLKDIAEQLRDVDQPVSDTRLVLQMEVARDMIEDGQSRIAAGSNNNRDTVLLHSTNQPSSDENKSPYPNGYRGKNYDPAKAAHGRGAHTRGGRNSGTNKNNSSQSDRGSGHWGTLSISPLNTHNYYHSGTPPASPQQSWFAHTQHYNQPNWTPPPTSYPSQPAPYHPQPNTNQHPSPHQAHLAHQPPPCFSQQPGNALCPSDIDIGVALSNMTLNYPDLHWNMDTGASSHITSDQGPQGYMDASFPATIAPETSTRSLSRSSVCSHPPRINLGMLVSAVVELAAIGFDLPKDTFTNLMKLVPHLLGTTGSDLGSHGEEGTVFAGYHYDINFLRIHYKSKFPGLNIWLRNGEKVEVKVPDGCLLIQAGNQV
ncbi:putative isopenicillin N synthase [Helianthus debilis subsp. tardiflorus]